MKTQHRSYYQALLATLLSLSLGACGGADPSTARSPQSLVFSDPSATPALYLTRDDGSASALALTTPGDHTTINTFKRSPDQRYVAYTADDGIDPNLRLYVAKSDGSGVRLLSGGLSNSAASVSEFHWSPDSTGLVFLADGQSTGHIELYRVSADGASGPALTSGGFLSPYDIVGPKWSPNGRYIAYLLSDNGHVIGLNVHDTQLGRRTWSRVSRPSNNDNVPSYSDIASYEWSPDSTHLAYRADIKSDGQTEIFTAQADGSAHQLANGDSANTVKIMSYQWSADSRYLAETVYRLSDNAYVGLNLWDTQGASSVRVASANILGKVAWSKRGARLAFVDNHENSETAPHLYVYDAPSSTLKTVAHGGPSTYGIVTFLWSHNDAALAYAADSGLFLAQGDFSTASTALHPFTNTQSPFSLQWSPGDERIAFWVSDANTLSSDLYSVSASADATAVRLTPSALDARVTRVNGPQWSNDGTRLLYGVVREGPSPNGSIISITPDGSAESALSETYQTGYFDY